MHIHIYITIYLPYCSYVFRYAIHFLQIGILVYLIKTTFFYKVVIYSDLRHRT